MEQCSFLMAVERLRPTASHSDLVLIDYITSFPETTSKLTIAELAEHTNLSYATVCRLFGRLGYSGIKAFREAICEYLDARSKLPFQNTYDQSTFTNMNFLSFYSQESVKERICDMNCSVIENCRSFLNTRSFKDATEALVNANFVYFVGQGTSAVSAHYACIKLYRVGINCSFESDTMLMKQRTSLLTKNDVVFAISSSGRTKAILESAQLAKANGITVISLSDYSNCPLSKYSDIVFYTSQRNANAYPKEDFPLIVGQITMIDLIHAEIFTKRDKESQSFYLKTRNIANMQKTDIDESSIHAFSNQTLE